MKKIIIMLVIFVFTLTGCSYIELNDLAIANALGIDIESVNVKATTEEKLGFTGTREGIAAQAVCLID